MTMSLFDTKKNSAICVLPWVHEYKRINGKTAPCCLGDTFKGNETISQTREFMLKGESISKCPAAASKASACSPLSEVVCSRISVTVGLL